eukprot:TRINITY_DN21991_c0_g1_i1.p1 TRINITY_DN21991_c0_g1~~TRINITY_DN21991_c0_g1_i1.p1  ORF type:complete len:375 (-),score=92.69 TRINITY_DN21991_c0_g1_i1:75-1199(-)
MANSMLADMSKLDPSDVAKAKRWPKVELHLHLDGSLSPDFIARRALVRGIMLPAPPERLRAWLMDRKLDKLKKDDNKADKGGNWPVFDFCNQFLQTELELREGTADLLARLWEDGVVYAEIRFCPELHTNEGLSEEQVVEAVIAGFRSQNYIKGGLILVALRSKEAAHGVHTARLAAKYIQKTKEDLPGVVGMDVAGDEGTYPLASDKDAMVEGVKEALKLDVPLSLHAGEWPEKFGSLENLKWAISSGARRIGHSIALRSEPELSTLMQKNNITVEVCLTSNIGNGFKVANYSVHPVRVMQQQGVAFSLSSDNLLLSGDHAHAPSPTAEILHLVNDVGLGWEAAKWSIINGLKSAFSPSVDQEFIDQTLQKLN